MSPSVKAADIRRVFQALGDAAIAEHAQGFFKTGKGEYGEGDRFHGIRVPVVRKQVKKYQGIHLDDALIILQSPFHEERLFALLVWVDRFAKGDEKEKRIIYKHYLANTKYVNNWDLVDSSAGQIVGAYLYEKDRKPLYRLAESRDLWERRIAILATFYFIKRDDFTDTLEISRLLLPDSEDLIHKAAGWMLREIGNRQPDVEKAFLRRHYRDMPRTMLRYAIEKFPPQERQRYLKGLLI